MEENAKPRAAAVINPYLKQKVQQPTKAFLLSSVMIPPPVIPIEKVVGNGEQTEEPTEVVPKRLVEQATPQHNQVHV